MVTRGWLDPQNRTSPSRSERVRPGERYDLRSDLQPDDHVFKAGNRIGLVVVSTDHDYTIRPNPGTQFGLSGPRTGARSGCRWWAGRARFAEAHDHAASEDSRQVK